VIANGLPSRKNAILLDHETVRGEKKAPRRRKKTTTEVCRETNQLSPTPESNRRGGGWEREAPSGGVRIGGDGYLKGWKKKDFLLMRRGWKKESSE